MMDTAKLANNEISALLAWESRSRQSHSQITAQAVFWRLSRTRDCGLGVPDALLESQLVVCGGEVADMAKQANDDADGIGSSKLRRLMSDAGIGITDCYLCCTPIFSEEEAAIDHVLPSRWGGSNLVGNLAWSHRRCNIVKSAMLMCLDIPQRMEAEREGTTLTETEIGCLRTANILLY